MYNSDQAEGNWKQFTGKIKEAWGDLTDNDITLLKGKRDQFFGKVQEKYGIAREEAEKKVREFEKACNYEYDNKAA